MRKIVFIFLFCFGFFNLLLISVEAFTLDPVESLNETTVKGFTDKELGAGKSNDEAEAALINSGVIYNISSGVGQILAAALSFLGILFLLLMIYAGILWMGARGNEQEIEKAKNLISAAVIGLVVIIMAYAITNYLGTSLI